MQGFQDDFRLISGCNFLSHSLLICINILCWMNTGMYFNSENVNLITVKNWVGIWNTSVEYNGAFEVVVGLILNSIWPHLIKILFPNVLLDREARRQ